MYREDFDEVDQKWETYTSGASMGKIHDGYYDLISMNDKAHAKYAFVSNMDWSQDWQLEIRMKQINGKDNSSNDIIWDRESGNSNKYHFGFTSAGKYNLSEYDQGYQAIVDFTAAEFVNKKGFNKITVRKVRGTYHYFLNERYIISSSYSKVKGDYIGFMVPPNSTLQVDYIDVSYLDQMSNNMESVGYNVVMTKSNGYTVQRWKTRDEFPKAEIKKEWDEGYSISNLSHDNGKWTLVTAKGTGFSNQQWRTRADFPKDEISESWSEGRSITELNYGNGLWALVMSKTSNYGLQRWATSSNFPVEKIKEFRDSGLYISELIYGEDRWALVGTKDSRITSQSWNRSQDFPRDEIEQLGNQGYIIAQLEYHNNSWILVMNKMIGNARNIWFSSTSFPKTKIREYWDQGYYLTDITHYTNNSPETKSKDLLADLLVGKWYGGAAGEAEQGHFIFDSDRTVTMTTEGDTLGGKDWVIDGKAFSLRYEITNSTSPKGIDLVIYSAGEKLGSMKGIIRMINEDELEMKISPMGEARPTELKNESDSKVAVFKRKKNSDILVGKWNGEDTGLGSDHYIFSADKTVMNVLYDGDTVGGDNYYLGGLVDYKIDLTYEIIENSTSTSLDIIKNLEGEELDRTKYIFRMINDDMFEIEIENSIFKYKREKISDILVGKWAGGLNGVTDLEQFIFGADKMFTLITQGDTIGGKNYYENDVKIDLKYEAFETTTPKGIDIIFFSSKGEDRRIKAIINIIDNDRFEIKTSQLDELRPTEMKNEPEKPVIIFKRVK